MKRTVAAIVLCAGLAAPAGASDAVWCIEWFNEIVGTRHVDGRLVVVRYVVTECCSIYGGCAWTAGRVENVTDVEPPTRPPRTQQTNEGEPRTDGKGGEE